ncbi:MAG TPA: indole-3-glycerol phosphate synthase TrpC [Acidimicrobiia bacterium]
MTSILDEILVTKRDEVTVLRRPDTRDLLRRTALEAPPTRGFAAALRADPTTLKVIAEIKRRSPSKGELAPDLEPASTARAYAVGGAAALSVLTDGPYFGGSMADLQQARSVTNIPVLRKDFVIDEVQVYEARAVGADAVLLIVAALPDDALLRDLHELALGLGLDALVEVHDGDELERAAGIGARVVGVNSRSLQTFGEDLGVAQSLRAAIAPSAVAVAESAIRSVDDAQRMADAGFDAVLVGEALVRATDPTALCAALSSCSRSTST